MPLWLVRIPPPPRFRDTPGGGIPIDTNDPRPGSVTEGGPRPRRDLPLWRAGRPDRLRCTMDLEPVYDWTGSVVGWVAGDRVLDRGGKDAAVRHGDWVYDYAGTALGTYTGGWFRNV